jgi:hypothetical protein
LSLIVVLLVLLAAGAGGWFLGFRDGASMAYADVSTALTTYHLAQSRQDSVTAQRAVDRCTGNVVSHLLNGRHQLPLVDVFPYRSEYSLAQLRAVWTPPDRLILAPKVEYPYTVRGRKYRAEFEAIRPAEKVEYVRWYAEE